MIELIKYLPNENTCTFWLFLGREICPQRLPNLKHGISYGIPVSLWRNMSNGRKSLGGVRMLVGHARWKAPKHDQSYVNYDVQLHKVQPKSCHQPQTLRLFFEPNTFEHSAEQSMGHARLWNSLPISPDIMPFRSVKVAPLASNIIWAVRRFYHSECLVNHHESPSFWATSLCMLQ